MLSTPLWFRPVAVALLVTAAAAAQPGTTPGSPSDPGEQEPPANTAPTAVPDAAETREDEPLTVAVLSNDSDAEGDALTVLSVGAPRHGTAATDGETLHYTPAPDFFGADSLAYVVSDGSLTAEGVLHVAVHAVNDAPSRPALVSPESGGVVSVGDGALPLGVTWTPATDVDGDPVTFRWELSASTSFASPLLRVSSDTAGVAVGASALLSVLDALGVRPGEATTLYHRAVATDGVASTEGPSAELMVSRAGDATATDPPIRHATLWVGPNPASRVSVATLDLPTARPITLTVYDALGREVARLHDGPLAAGITSVSIGPLAAGLYVLRLSPDGPGLPFTVTR